MATQCPALMDSSKTGLGPSTQVLILKTVESVWLCQSCLCFLTDIPYGPTSDIAWAVWLCGLLGKPGPDHSEQAGGPDCTISLLSSTRLQQSMGTLETCWGYWDLPASSLVWPLCIGLQMKLLLYSQVSSLGSSPSSFTLEGPFSYCYICRTLVSLVTYAPLSCCGDWSEATSAGHTEVSAGECSHTPTWKCTWTGTLWTHTGIFLEVSTNPLVILCPPLLLWAEPVSQGSGSL